MKTRYSSLVSVKKNIMQKSERTLQSANATLNRALTALEISYNELDDIVTPCSGLMPEFLAIRTLLDAQRALIKQNDEWVEFAKREILVAQEQLKKDTIEFEKFHHLELQEIKEMLRKIKIEESKELDEVALMTYSKKQDKKEVP